MTQPEFVAAQCAATGSRLPSSAVFVDRGMDGTLNPRAVSAEDAQTDQAYETLYQWLGRSTPAPAWLVAASSTSKGYHDDPVPKPACCKHCQKELRTRYIKLQTRQQLGTSTLSQSLKLNELQDMQLFRPEKFIKSANKLKKNR